MIYSLWTRNRAGEPQGVFSHQTALSIYELSDVNPSTLHLTVPPSFRRSALVPKVLALHRATVSDQEVEQRQGFAVTRPLRTVIDRATAESVSRDIIKQALTKGRRRGQITVREMAAQRGQGNLTEWFEDLLPPNKR